MLAFQSGDFCCQPASTFETTTTKATATTSSSTSTTKFSSLASTVVEQLPNKFQKHQSNINIIKNSLKDYVVIVALIVSLHFVNHIYHKSNNKLQVEVEEEPPLLASSLIVVVSGAYTANSVRIQGAGGTTRENGRANSDPKVETDAIIEVYRKNATTNPTTSRNYYISRGGGGGAGGATTGALGTHPSGPTGASGSYSSSNSMMKHQHHHQQQQAQSQQQQQQQHQHQSSSSSSSSKLTMADRLNIGGEVRELKLGSTFNSKNTTTAFHTIKYDFKPASVDFNRVATVDIGSNNQVTVTVPNLESSGVPHTVYKGNHRKYAKECLLIFDRHTGVMTLEKLNHNIQVKKTRSEMTSKQPIVPPQKLENSTMRISSKTKVSTGSKRNNIIGYVPRNSPMQQGSPSSTSVTHKSPQSAPAWNANNAQATLPSIPMIIDDDEDMGLGLTLPTGGPSSNANTSSSSSASSHNNSGDFQMHQKSKQSQQKQHNNHQRQQQQQHQVQPHQRQPPQHQQMQQHQPQQQQYQFQPNKNHQTNPSQQQQYHQVPTNRLPHQPTSNISPGFGGGNSHGHSNSNSFRPSGSSSSNLADQSMDSAGAVLERQIGCGLSSSESSSDSDSSDSGSDSDDSTDNIPQNNHQSNHIQTQQPQHLHHQQLQQQQPQQQPINSNSYSNGGFPALLHDDLQLSESNSSDSSSDDDD